MQGVMEIYSDGGARGNPGPGACAFVVKLDGKVVAQESRFLGEVTNNFAEYSGVILALNYLLKNPSDVAVNFYMDSELVVRQINGGYKVKSTTLKKIFEEVKNLLSEVSTEVYFKNIPRSKNQAADFLVNKELDQNISL